MDKFWETKELSELTEEQWESLCDGCGLCCLHKLEDEDTGDIYYTTVCCKLLDIETCRCTDYSNRVQRVPSCLKLSLQSPEVFPLLPETCAYRLRFENKPLPDWHPLVCQDPLIIHEQGISVRDFALPEAEVDLEDLEDYLME